MGYRIGIDAGSKTIKIVAIDDAGKLLFCFYRRHRANIKDTLTALLNRARQRHWDVSGSVCVTGSAGMQIASDLGIPFVQEVEAATAAVRALVPQANAFVELGGEDAKIVYLDGRLEQRMNATCAGGTGAFIDTIARMLGMSPRELSEAAAQATALYPIASRCAVFAQTDVRPLLASGAQKADVAASVLQAVVDQTVAGLACGRPLEGTVAFLGGPCEFLPSLVARFRATLGLDERTGVKPDNAQFYPALGAALSAGAGAGGAQAGPRTATEAEAEPGAWRLSELAQAMKARWCRRDELDALAPLFASDDEHHAFAARHAAVRAPRFAAEAALATSRNPGLQERIDHLSVAFARGGDLSVPGGKAARLSAWEGKRLFLGIDAGSTAVKMALVDEDGALVGSASETLSGNVLATATRLFERVYSGLPRQRGGDLAVPIEHACATGYGEGLLTCALALDSSVVETVAHLTAARHLVPDVDFILDIGGQDMKALWVRDGRIERVVINEACSSGCGSLIEGFAHSFGESPLSFARLAERAERPVDLGIRCTVFMTSRVRHAQKLGTPVADIAAGLSYSVVKNALFKVIGVRDGSELGRRIVVEGGTFKSDAVLRAFELVSGREVARPDIAEVMGAYGAALVARDRANAARKAAGAAGTGDAGAAGHQTVSSLIPLSAARRLSPKTATASCPGCGNACVLSVSEFAEGGGAGRRACVSGNRCARGERLALGQLAGAGGHGERRATRPSNVFKLEQRLLERCAAAPAGTARRGRKAIGLPGALGLHAARPFWTAFLASLGFAVVAPGVADAKARRDGLASIPSESVCHPAKLYHLEAADLAARGVDALFMPSFSRSGSAPDTSGGPKPPLACPVNAAAARTVAENLAALQAGAGSPQVLQPRLSSDDPAAIAHSAADRAALSRAFGVPDAAIARALGAGLAAQGAHLRLLAQAVGRALGWMERTEGRGILLAARPYHNDARASHGIDDAVAELGYAVLSAEAVDAYRAERGAKDEGTGAAAQGGEADGGADASRWQPVRALEEAVRFAAATPRLDAVHLASFGCGIDAMESWRLRRILEAAGKPYTKLTIDEMVDLAHVRIRLRTLDAALREADGRASSGDACASALRERAPSHAGSGEARVIEGHLRTVESQDVSAGQGLVGDDVCYPIITIAGQIARVADAQEAGGARPGEIAFHLPPICRNCLIDSLPATLSHALGRPVRLVFDGAFPAPAAPSAAAGSGRAPVGILGNGLLCFDPFVNRSLAHAIEAEGCRAVLPDPALIDDEDVRFPRQIERFRAAGVRDIVYVQSFGCLKGHVQARGALRELERAYPDLRITVIDCDPGTSAANQESRIKLALAAAKRR